MIASLLFKQVREFQYVWWYFLICFQYLPGPEYTLSCCVEAVIDGFGHRHENHYAE